MILVTVHGPDGAPLAWVDTQTRTVHEHRGDVALERPLTDSENAAVDALLAAQARAIAAGLVREELAAGVAAITAAREAAAADIPTAEGLAQAAAASRDQASAQRAQVAGWTPSTTYRAADLVAVRDQLVTVLNRQAAILDALVGANGWRPAVDRNAVTTDNALLGLARLTAGMLDDSQEG